MRGTISNSEIALAYRRFAERYDADTFALFWSTYTQTIRRLEDQYAELALGAGDRVKHTARGPRGARRLQGSRVRSWPDRGPANGLAHACSLVEDIYRRQRSLL